ncbi:hypothetical protein KAU39_01630 [bacterium]|nr:hypothetical protein [bacterium]
MVFYQDNQLLFYEGDLDARLRSHYGQAQDKVNAIPKDQFLLSSDEEIIENIQNSLLVDHITLHEDSMEMVEQEVKVDVSHNRDRNPFGDRGPIFINGIRITVSVPFSGDMTLWKLKPNSGQSVFPRGNIRRPNHDRIGYLDIVIELPSDEGPEKIKSLIDETLRSVRFYLNNQKNQIENQNAALPEKLRQAIQNRRTRLKVHDGIVEALNIPLKRKDRAPSVKPIPIRRKLVRPLPPPPKSGYKDEPGISNEDYEHILSVIRHEGRTFETTPKTYAVHDEEELRDIILAHLNGHYQGDATGETFRRNGKTDIRIEDSDKAAFVAECKIWRGAKGLLETIDQLLGYLTWRDCKAAIILFNKKNAKFTELLDKVPETICEHSKLKKNLGEQEAGEWKYILLSDEDEMRDIHVHIFLFNLYTKK